MPTYTFDKVTSQAKRSVKCPGCKRRRTIRRTFMQTVNPFNKNDDGTVKTRPEVTDAVIAEARAWEPSGRELFHDKCWDDYSQAGEPK